MKRKDFTAVTRIVRLFIVLFLTTFAYSCSTFNEQPETVTQNAATMTTPGKRSVEQALANLQIVLDAIDGGTRSRTRSIRSIETVYCEEVLAGTRSETSKEGELVYIVNFENNDGYAVLGADEQLAPVITVTEKGSVSQKDLLINPDAMKDLEYEKLDQDSDPDYKDSPFYDAEDDDFYLGESDSTFANTLISSYLNNFLRNDGEFEYADDCPHNPDDGIDTVRDTVRVTAILKTKWNQSGAPFNSKIHMYDSVNRRPAGCTVAAAAQLFANRKTTDISVFNLKDTTCTWDSLECCKFGSDLIDADKEEEISTIYKTLADAFKIKYNYFGTGNSFAKPADVCRYMKKNGFDNAELKRYYSKKNLLDMIGAGKPVFMGAFILRKICGHAWIIDGMIAYRERKINRGETLSEEIIGQTMFHCNWGWGGTADGYYTSQVFDTNAGPVETDTTIDFTNSKTDKGVYFDSSTLCFYRHIMY